MNPDFPHPDPADPEVRITAFLLGELPPDAKAAVERDLARDPELARLRTRLAQTIELVREATKQPGAGAEPAPGVAGPRLSRERRRALFAAFKTIRPFPTRSGWNGLWHGRRRLVLAVAAGFALLLTAGLVRFRASSKGKELAQSNYLVEREVQARAAAAEALQQTSEAAPEGRLFLRRGTERLAAGQEPATDRVRLWSVPDAAELTAAASPAAGAASPQPPPGIARPMMDVRLLQRYGLQPKDGTQGAQKEFTAAGGDYDNDGEVRFSVTAGRGAFTANQSAAAPANGRFLKEKAQDKAAPANVLQDWFALVTNRAAEPEIVNGALGYTWNDQAGRAAGGLGGVARTGSTDWGAFGGGQFGRSGAAGGLAGGAGGLAGGGFGGGGAGGFGGRALAEGEGRATTTASFASQPARPSTVQLGEGLETAGKPVEADFAFRMAVDANQVAAAPSSEAIPVPAAEAAGVTVAPATVAELATAAPEATVLGDRPTLGRAFRSLAPDASSLTPAQRAAQGAQRGDDSSRARGRSLALGVEVAKEVEDLEALPLQLPVPAFMGTPTDIPLAAGASVTAARAKASSDLYFDVSLGKAEERQRSLTDHLSVERYDEALLNKGLPALQAEAARGETEALVRNMAPSRLGELRQQVDELRRGGVSLADTKAEADGIESARKELVVEQLAERKQVATPSDRGLEAGLVVTEAKRVPTRPTPPPPVPQPEVASLEHNFSTFSLNVADVSFKLAAASLDAGNLPDPASIRVEEFVNAFDYRDPGPVAGAPISFDWERAQYPFAHNREMLRFSIQTAAQGREQGRPLNLVLLLDNSGSMERADRVNIIREALHVLGGQLQPQDKISVVAFARNGRLWVDALSGDRGAELPARVGNLVPEGGTNLEEALKQGYETARRHFVTDGVNRVILLTDGAANLGDVAPDSLKRLVEEQRRRGIALDSFGIGWDGYNDDLLEVLSRNGDGRYGFVNSVEEVATGFANQLAGALQVAAADVKAQVEFNPARVTNWRQVGYAKHQLTQEQFRDNTVDAAELGAAEAGNALYVIEVNPQGQGPIGVMRVRYRVPATGQYREHEWALEYHGPAVTPGKASASMRLATAAAAFGEMLSNNPYAAEVNSPALLALLDGVPRVFDPDPRPAQFENMLRQTQAIAGR